MSGVCFFLCIVQLLQENCQFLGVFIDLDISLTIFLRRGYRITVTAHLLGFSDFAIELG